MIRVQCINSEGTGKVIKGHVYRYLGNTGQECIAIVDRYGKETALLASRFIKVKEDKDDMEYTFYASSIDAVDVELVREGLTRKKPMAYLVIPGVQEYKVVLHDYVWRKAQNSGEIEGHYALFTGQLERLFQDEECTLVRRKDMGALVSLIKEIVRCPWADKEAGKDIKVTATYVEIA